ncbi:HAD family hydrolase [Streptacidiphilus melanogenes]|uniref:HAD family hydrolase n=1 Tax=Streptacidiphilus melanogenes TaxID=411235 RepID=UPI0005A8A396|nr:HAD family hydrolase [Streptacidiphilus melanogenes]
MGDKPTPPTSTTVPILVSDFDGTVYRSDDPVRFYARRVADSLRPAQSVAFLDTFERYLAEGVAAADAAVDPAEAKALLEAEDGWGLVQALAADLGLGRPVTQQAFLDSRIHMLDDACGLEVVEPLVDLFAELRGDVRIVLATNSPAEGLAPLLDRMGLTGAFDEVVAGAGKPAGLRAWMAGALEGGRSASALFSLGDHYRNEIEPAVALGAATGYIDRFGRADGPATATAARVEDLLPAVTSWALSRSVGRAHAPI